MNSCYRVAVVTLLVMGTTASVNAEQPMPSETTRSRIEKTSSVTTPLSALETARAEAWGLSQTEWLRYRSLMEGVRGSISPSTLSPIEVLGIHARDESERQRYARAMREDAKRILAFQRAYGEAWKRLFPAEFLIDLSRLPEEPANEIELRPDDRVLLFTRPGCAACEMILQRLLRKIDAIAGVDIYLLDLPSGDDAAVRDWASRQTIDPDWVRNRRVTLNHDGGALADLTEGKGEAPYLLRRRGESLSLLPAGTL